MAILTQGVIPASALVTHQRPDWLTHWSNFAAALRFGDLPEQTVRRSELVVLDCLGAIIAGHAEKEMVALRKRTGCAPPLDAFLDGTAGTTLEIDEGNQYARGHPAIHVVPALLSLARRKPVTGQQFLLATTLGYEIGARIGIASKLRVTMHPHGTWGVIGAALAAAKLDDAPAETVADVVNVASSLGLTTSRRTMLEGATVRNSYAGFANMLGLIAYDMVRAGFTGEADGVGSVYGGIAAEHWAPAEMTNDLGSRWEIARNYFKRHAACRYNHGALDALDSILLQAGNVAAEDVAELSVATYVWAAQLDHPEPASMLAAKFSIPYSLSARIVQGHTGLDAFRDAARLDERTRALARRITVNEDETLTARLPGERPARVTLVLTDGRRWTKEVATNRGDTENPYSEAEVVEKFHEVAGAILGRERAKKLVEAALNLRKAHDLSSTITLARPE